MNFPQLFTLCCLINPKLCSLYFFIFLWAFGDSLFNSEEATAGKSVWFCSKGAGLVLRTHNLTYFRFLVLNNFLKSENKQIWMLKATVKQKLFPHRLKKPQKPTTNPSNKMYIYVTRSQIYEKCCCGLQFHMKWSSLGIGIIGC